MRRPPGARYGTAVARATTTPQMDWTGNPEADHLVSTDPAALLIGFCLDQQVPVEWAFMGPLKMKERLGTIEPTRIAKMDPGDVERAFRTPPALHRYPGSMAQRVYALCTTIANDYGGDASRIWTEAKDARDLKKRFAALPGFGDMKAQIMVGVVAKQLGVHRTGWEEIAPTWPTLADVHTTAEREEYQTQKRAYKAKLRAEAAAAAPRKSSAPARGRR